MPIERKWPAVAAKGLSAFCKQIGVVDESARRRVHRHRCLVQNNSVGYLLCLSV